MRQFIKVGVISLLIIGLGLFLRTIIPIGRFEEEFSINPKISLFSDELECSYLQELIESKFILNYSKAVRYKESGDILVTIEKPNLDAAYSYKTDFFRSCTVSLEVWIDGKDLLVEPGNRIIEPYLSNQDQNFRFEIFPIVNQLRSGTIWIYAVIPDEENSALERIPLFAIPFSIHVESLMGISPKIIRNFSFMLTLLAALLLYFYVVLNKNQK